MHQYSRRWTRGLGLASALVSCMLLLAACGDDDEGAAAKDAASSPKGEVLKVMVMSADDNPIYNFPGVWEVAKAYAEDVNAKGGINDRPLEIIECNEAADPNRAERCARQAVEEGAVAFVGGVTIHADRVFPVLEEAGMPWLGNSPLLAPDFQSKMSFPIPPYPDEFAAAANQVAKCSNPTWTHLDTATGKSLFDSFATPGFRAVHPDASPEPVAVVSPKITDFEPVAAQLAKGDCIYLQLPEPIAVQLLPALKRAGSEAKIYTVGANFTTPFIEAAPDVTEGAVIVSSSRLPSTAPEWQEARDAVEKYASDDVTLNGTNDSNAWLSLKIFTEIASRIDGEITSQAVVDELNQSGAVEADGLMPPIDFTKEFDLPGFPRLFNHQVIDWTVKDGELADAENAEFYDVADILREGHAAAGG